MVRRAVSSPLSNSSTGAAASITLSGMLIVFSKGEDGLSDFYCANSFRLFAIIVKANRYVANDKIPQFLAQPLEAMAGVEVGSALYSIHFIRTERNMVDDSGIIYRRPPEVRLLSRIRPRLLQYRQQAVA